MGSSVDSRHVARVMLSWLDLDLVSLTELQSLWAGYGHICAIKARPRSAGDDPSPSQSRQAHRQLPKPATDGTLHLILKLVSPPAMDGDEGHLRKMLSYEVEQSFYDQVAPRLLDEDGVAVARCLASTRRTRSRAVADGLQDLMATILTDLRDEFPVAGEKRALLSPRQVRAAVEWLAMFHASSWKRPLADMADLVLPPLEEAERRARLADDFADGKFLWLNGGYTYLATRRSEYDKLARDRNSEWSSAFCAAPPGVGSGSSIAEQVAAVLTPCGRAFETYIHGDVKSENLFSTDSGDRVAFFDFQYAGLGLGVCDLAKLFTCSVPLDMLVGSRALQHAVPMDDGERGLLEEYRHLLLRDSPEGPGRSPLDYGWDTFRRHWETALVDWCRFQASWGFWGNTTWLQARVRWILKDESWMGWLQQEARSRTAGCTESRAA
ncbi:hypothetical protein RJ55_00250 [Drechmeria coniospora]|nr:hypothetical protein RJ55_00250 [Drechmeria coniospora]